MATAARRGHKAFIRSKRFTQKDIALRQRFSASPYRTCMSDMRLHVAAANSYFYPDLLVTCSALDLASVALELSASELFAEVLEF